ncbi:MAG: FAD-dependent thymidylate synthase [Endomicrobium sp.]|jgi:thymidylate synthase (FAD)|nr:FAD-dependent thymidylate synthase [Endomicrobium sp.]
MKVKLLRFTKEPEEICALAARMCYSSVDIDEIVGNFTKEKIKKLLAKIISSKHHSVLEHASFTFGIEGVSRALLAQLTRHRIASFSVQSQRYVKFKKNIEFVTSETIKKNKYLFEKYNEFLKIAEELYKELLNAGVPAEDARYVLPNASSTTIIITMNARELRHFFSLRTCNRAQWEIRNMAYYMLELVKKKAPLLFSDAGPDCVREGCHETLTCGKAWGKI